MKNKKCIRIFGFLLAMCLIVTTSACSLFEGFSADVIYFPSYFYEENIDCDSEEQIFTPNEPNKDKLVLRELTDEIGHKIVYYTDGTFEDLGRIEPIDFSATPLEEQYAYNALKAEKKGEALRAFYADLFTEANKFHNSGADLKVEEDGYYIVAMLDYSKWGLTNKEAFSVWNVFANENPVYYWISPQLSYTDQHLYLLADTSYAKAEDRKFIQTKIKEMAFDCDKYLSGTTPLVERALTIYDYLIYAIEYAYETDGVTPSDANWAHNITGGALYGKGVCEAYAQTYDYFCQLFGLDCITVTGTLEDSLGTVEKHAWNYLCLDENWYAVDVTGGDQQYLLRSYFGQELSEHYDTYIADNNSIMGLTYQCVLPVLSQGLCPVLLSKDGGTPLMQPSIDAAFKQMTDEKGRYVITLYPDTKVTAEKGETIYHIGAKIFSTETLPKVNFITFRGWREYADSTHTLYYQAELKTAKPITLQCNVRMDKVTYSETSWIKNGYVLFSE